MLPKILRICKRNRKTIPLYFLVFIICCALYQSVNKQSFYKNGNIGLGNNFENEKVQKQIFQVRKKYPDSLEFSKEDMLDENGEPYQIMLWMAGEGTPSYTANPQECLGNIKCEISYIDVENAHLADAIVFKFDQLSPLYLPKIRYPSQLYAWWISESPLHSFIADDSPHFFNLTFHYRTDADIYAPYGSINLILRELRAEGETDIETLLAKKRNSDKIAAWAVSNCYTKRIAYGKNLMKAGLKLDTFGLCFNAREIGEGSYSKSFYEELSKYKFYLAFENSIDCLDYITEKFWYNGLKSGAVPIVWGPRKEDVLKVAPAKSFIHTSDFETPEKLVEYLDYLSNNETAYAEYLEWRTWVKHPEKMEERFKIKSADDDLRSFCKLCAVLQAQGKRKKHNLPVRSQTIASLDQAWLGPEKNRCRA